MKFILIDTENIKTNYQIRRHNIGKTHNIHEILLNEEKICKLMRQKSGLLNKICYMIYTCGLKRKIAQVLCGAKSDEASWKYILGNNMLRKKDLVSYVISILDKNGGKRFSVPSEMHDNIHKYILNYAEEKQLPIHELKVLLVYTNTYNINLTIMQECINRYKKVNLYMAEKPNESILNRINKINKDNGSSIEVIKYSKKAFLEYDIIYFVDDVRTNYPRMRISKSSLVVDNNDSLCDKYNSNLLFLKTISDNIENHETLNNKYGKLNVATVIRKTIS